MQTQMRIPLQQWVQTAAHMLLPHNMRDMTDLLLGDGWRPGLADNLTSASGAGPQQGQHGQQDGGGRAAQDGRDEAQQRQPCMERRPMPPGGAAPPPGPRMFSKLASTR